MCPENPPVSAAAHGLIPRSTFKEDLYDIEYYILSFLNITFVPKTMSYIYLDTNESSTKTCLDTSIRI